MNVDDDIALAYLDALRTAVAERRALREELAAIGAERNAEGIWCYPFYTQGGGSVLIPRDEWIARRKRAGELVNWRSPDADTETPS